MLTKEFLTSNDNLKNLDPTIIDTIVTLSRDDENKVIAAKVREIHDRYDQDVKEVTGIEKEYGVKSYENVKRALKLYMDKAEKTGSNEEANQRIKTLEDQNKALNEKIKNGVADQSVVAQFETQINDLKGQNQRLIEQINTDKANYEKDLNTERNKTLDFKSEFEFSTALKGVKFKAGIPEVAINSTIEAAKNRVLLKGQRDWIKNDDGKEVMIFRDENKMPLANPNNSQRPFTGGELLLNELKDIIDLGQQQNGAGTGKNNKNGSITILDLGSAKTKREANEIIVQQILSEGLTKGTSEFNERQQALRTENKVSELPLM